MKGATLIKNLYINEDMETLVNFNAHEGKQHEKWLGVKCTM